jgi:hypothetical protein
MGRVGVRGTEAKCLQRAASQHGVIARWQVTQSGLSRQQLRSLLAQKRWEHVLPGVFRISGAPEDWRQKLHAALLWAGRGAALSHRTAAALHGFARFRESGTQLVSHLEKRAPRGVSLYKCQKLVGADVTRIDGLLVTSVERTLLDLAATESEADVRACLDEALRRKWTALDDFELVLRDHDGKRGVAMLRRLVATLQGAGGPTESEMESRVRDLLEANGFPQPVSQHAVYAGGRLRRLDFKFAGSKVVIEADGYAYHSSPAAFERDRERLNALLVRGFVVLQWTWKALLERPDELLAQLRCVLGAAAA